MIAHIYTAFQNLLCLLQTGMTKNEYRRRLSAHLDKQVEELRLGQFEE